MPACAPGDTIGLTIPDYAGNPANEDAPPVTSYTTAQQALSAELKQIAPRLNAAQFGNTYSRRGTATADGQEQFAFFTDGRPGIVIDVEGGTTWRVVRTASCTAVIGRYR